MQTIKASLAQKIAEECADDAIERLRKLNDEFFEEEPDDEPLDFNPDYDKTRSRFVEAFLGIITKELEIVPD